MTAGDAPDETTETADAADPQWGRAGPDPGGDARDAASPGQPATGPGTTVRVDDTAADRWVPRDPAPPAVTDADRQVLAARVPSRTRDWLALPGLGFVVAGLALPGTPVGVGAGVATLVIWLVATPVYVATTAALLAGALGAGLTSGALVGAGVGLVLLGPIAGHRRPLSVLGGTLAVGVVLAAVVAGGLQAVSPLVAALGLVVTVAAVLYGLHRYSLLRVVVPDVHERE